MIGEIIGEVVKDVVKDVRQGEDGAPEPAAPKTDNEGAGAGTEEPSAPKTKEQIKADRQAARQQRQQKTKEAVKSEIANDKANAKTSTEGMGGGSQTAAAPSAQSVEGTAPASSEQPQQQEQQPEQKPGVEGNTNATAAVGPGPSAVSTPEAKVEQPAEQTAPAPAENNPAPTSTEQAPAQTTTPAENNPAPTGDTQETATGNTAEGGNAPAAQQQNPQAPKPTIAKTDGLETESASNGVSQTESNTTTANHKTSESDTTKRQEINEYGTAAKAQYDTQLAEQQAKLAQAKADYTPKAVDQDIIDRLKTAKEGGNRRAIRRAQKDYDQAYQATWDEVYRKLDPDYKTTKEVKRENKLKYIFSAIGDFGTTLMAAGAAFNGVKYPIHAMTAGVAADIKESDAQRKALRATLEKMRQGKLEDPVKAMQKIMENREKALRNPAYYNEVTHKTGSEDSNGTSGTTSNTQTQKHGVQRKDPNPGKGGSGNGGFKTGNNEVTLTGPLGDNNLPDYMYSVDAGSLQAIGNATINKLEAVMGVEKEAVTEKLNGRDVVVTRPVVVENGVKRELNAGERQIYNSCIELAELLPTIKADADEKSLKSLQESYNKLLLQIWLGLKNYDKSKYQDFIDYLEIRPYVRKLTDEEAASTASAPAAKDGEDEWGVSVKTGELDDDDE